MLRKIIFDLSIKYQTFFLFCRQRADFDPWKLPAGIWSGRLLFLCLLLSTTLEWFCKVLTQKNKSECYSNNFQLSFIEFSPLTVFDHLHLSFFITRKWFYTKTFVPQLVRVLRWLTCLRWPAFLFFYSFLSHPAILNGAFWLDSVIWMWTKQDRMLYLASNEKKAGTTHHKCNALMTVKRTKCRSTCFCLY